jgi:Cell Wall Hydrolase
VEPIEQLACIVGDDLPVVALATWKEACGEGELGMKAVMDVIFNRAKDWNKSLHDIVYARNHLVEEPTTCRRLDTRSYSRLRSLPYRRRHHPVSETGEHRHLERKQAQMSGQQRLPS